MRSGSEVFGEEDARWALYSLEICPSAFLPREGLQSAIEFAPIAGLEGNIPGPSADYWTHSLDCRKGECFG